MLLRIKNAEIINDILEYPNEDGSYNIPDQLKNNFVWFKTDLYNESVYTCCYCDENMWMQDFLSYEEMIDWINCEE